MPTTRPFDKFSEDAQTMIVILATDSGKINAILEGRKEDLDSIEIKINGVEVEFEAFVKVVNEQLDNIARRKAKALLGAEVYRRLAKLTETIYQVEEDFEAAISQFVENLKEAE